MAPYQYPQVPRGSQSLLLVQPELTQEYDNRFSWVATPAEAHGRSFRRQSEVPPLPALPNHLSSNPEPPPPPPPEPEPVAPSVAVPHPQQQFIEERGQSYYTSQSALGYPEPDTRGPSYYQNSSAGYQPPQLHQATEQHPEPAPTYTKEQKPRLQMDIPQGHSAAAATIDSTDQYKSPIAPNAPQHLGLGPDENPLSPTTPTKVLQRSPTTNLPVLTPSSVDFPASAYAPHAQPERGGTWQHTFCSCSLPSICLPSLICPCITYGKTQYRLALRSEKKDPTNMLGYHPINGSCMAFGILCGINSILAAIQHTRIRKAYDMDGQAGNVASDCLKGLCCCCCMVAQDEKEMKWREEECRKTAHLHGYVAKEGYTTPTGMVFQQPPRWE